MPELADDMYCSQQIMVPPMFPYILRQYAKAAIRSQPTDLLRWSTAYFRCLSLNLPPPVKPRLEYPIPQDYDGVTPGWLKALLYQLQNNTHVDFKVLWDRWMGACQNHLTLIKILCLGGFTDPLAVPLLRFIALCVGFLSENLTQTMILFCEVVTEEPEGGSAMISVETFIDVYTFLAAIDASKDQVLLNRYFTDDLLALIEERKSIKEKEGGAKARRLSVKETSTASELSQEEVRQEEDAREVISCPDLVEEKSCEFSSEDSDMLDRSKSTILDDKQRISAAIGQDLAEEFQTKEAIFPGETGGEGEIPNYYKDKEEAGEESICAEEASQVGKDVDLGEKELDPDMPSDEQQLEDQPKEDGEIGSAESRTSKPSPTSGEKEEPLPSDASFEKQEVVEVVEEQETEEGLKTSTVSSFSVVQKEVEEEDEAAAEGEEATVPSEKSIQTQDSKTSESEISKTMSEPITSELFKAPIEILGEYSVAEPETIAPEEELIVEGKFAVEEIFVEGIPGIGKVVPIDLVEAVITYMKRCAAEQQGMVMPRNIRHYSCPPLEEYQ